MSFDEIGEELNHFFNGGPPPQKRNSSLTKPYFQKQPKRKPVQEQTPIRFPIIPKLSLQDKVNIELYRKELSNINHNYYLTIHLGSKTYQYQYQTIEEALTVVKQYSIDHGVNLNPPSNFPDPRYPIVDPSGEAL